MAVKASAETVAADLKPPSYRSAVQVIRGSIQKRKDKIASTQSEIGSDWARVEGFKVDKRAGKIFAMLDQLEAQDQINVMRSLNGLIDAAGWSQNAADIVDRAQGNVVAMRVGGTSPAPDDDAQKSDGAGSNVQDASARLAALDRAREELANGGPKPDAYSGGSDDDLADGEPEGADTADTAADADAAEVAGAE